jgi:hypothetical protein
MRPWPPRFLENGDLVHLPNPACAADRAAQSLIRRGLAVDAAPLRILYGMVGSRITYVNIEFARGGVRLRLFILNRDVTSGRDISILLVSRCIVGTLRYVGGAYVSIAALASFWRMVQRGLS